MNAATSTPINLEEAFNALPDGIAVLDQGGYVVYLNPQFFALLNLDGTAVKNQHFSNIAKKTAIDIEGLVARVDAGRKAEQLLNTGESRFILASIRRIGQDSLHSNGIIIVLRDLSVIDHERKRVGDPNSKPAFKFLSQQKVRPDLAHQRRLSPS